MRVIERVPEIRTGLILNTPHVNPEYRREEKHLKKKVGNKAGYGKNAKLLNNRNKSKQADCQNR